jgi:hypothetical protein
MKMATTQPQYKTITTPLGKTNWAKLAKPETRFVKPTDPDWKQGGYYEVPLIFSGDDCKDLRQLVSDMHDANLSAGAEEMLTAHIEKFPKQKGKIKDAVKWLMEEKADLVNPLPFKQVRNEDGDLIDAYEFKFKHEAMGSSKKSGETWDVEPKVRDPRNQEYSEIPLIGNGSLARCVAELRGYRKPTFGIKLVLVATQIWELVEYRASGGGFEDSGFEANPDAPELVGAIAEFDDSREDVPF